MLTLYKDRLQELGLSGSARLVWYLFSDEYLSRDVLDCIESMHLYHDGLQLIDACIRAVQDGADVLSAQECDYLHDCLLMVRLNLLYHLNRWQEYIELFESFVPSKKSTIKPYSVYEMVLKKQEQLLRGKSIQHINCDTTPLSDEKYSKNAEYYRHRFAKHMGRLEDWLNQTGHR